VASIQRQFLGWCASLAAVLVAATCLSLGLARAFPSSIVAYTYDLDGRSDVYLLDLAHGSTFNITQTPSAIESRPAWSADGESLAYDRIENGDRQTCVWRFARERACFPALERFDSSTVTSPDGAYIAFVGQDSGGERLYVSAGDGAGLRSLTEAKGEYLSIAWMRDSKRLLAVFSGGMDDFDLYLIDVSDGSWQPLTDNMALDERPTLSPDGRQIVFTSDRDGGVHLYVMDVDGNDVRRATFRAGRNTDPTWRP
jgi:TolB protein